MTDTSTTTAASAAEVVLPEAAADTAISVTEPMPLTADGLRFLARRGSLSARAYERALGILGLRPAGGDWAVYWLRILLTAGLLFCVAGVICFFAFNWAAMSHFLKFGVIAALMVVTGGIAVWRGPDSLTGGLCLLACGLLAGPLLAVYGQYYQTGADPWELFRAWTIFLVLLALVGRHNGLWLAAWIVGSFWAVLGLYDVVLSNNYQYIMEYSSLGVWDALWYWPFLLLQLAALMVWEGAMYLARNRRGSFLQVSWLVRLAGCFVLILLTTINMASIIILSDGYYHDDFMPGMPFSGALMYIVLVGVGFWWYRRKRPDTLLLTLSLFSLIVLFYTFVMSFVDIWSAVGMLVMAILLIGLAFGATRLALHWHRQALRRGHVNPEERNEAKPWRHLLFLHNVTLPQLQARLGLDDPTAVTALDESLSHLEPWYIKLILSICGWVAAIFLIAFMGFVIFETGGFHHEGQAFVVFGVVFIIAGAFLVRSSLVFVRHFGLAVALAGALVLPAALVATFEMESFWQFPILFTAVICLIFVKHRAMRALAFFGVFMCIADLWLVLYAGLMEGTQGNIFVYYIVKLITLAVLSVVICLALKLWARESAWVQKPARDDFIRPVILTGLVAVLGFLGLYAAFFSGYGWHRGLWVWDLYFRGPYLTAFAHWAGLAAGVGLVFLARLWFKEHATPRNHRYIIYAGAMLSVFIAWWLPWLTIGLLLMALGRYIGNLALTGLSAFYLVVCLLWYYFTLEISLLHKSYTLLAAGLLMLLAGTIVYRLLYAQNQKEAAHA